MPDIKVDQNLPNLDQLIDAFVDLIKAMLARTKNRNALYNSIIRSFEGTNADQIIAEVRKLSIHTDKTLQMHWDFADLYKSNPLSEEDRKLFSGIG
jgi:hypothetical protein